MRAIKAAAAALVLSGVSVPVQAQQSLMFDSWGSCNSYLKQARKATSRGSDSHEAARWDAAYCRAVAFQQVMIVFPL